MASVPCRRTVAVISVRISSASSDRPASARVPAIRTRNAGFCTADEARMAAGNFVDPSVQGFKTLFQLAEADPNGVSPIPVFPPGTTNLQALLFAFTLPDASNPLNFTDDFVRLIGDPFTTTLTYSSIDRVFGFGDLIENGGDLRVNLAGGFARNRPALDLEETAVGIGRKLRTAGD